MFGDAVITSVHMRQYRICIAMQVYVEDREGRGPHLLWVLLGEVIHRVQAVEAAAPAHHLLHQLLLLMLCRAPQAPVEASCTGQGVAVQVGWVGGLRKTKFVV